MVSPDFGESLYEGFQLGLTFLYRNIKMVISGAVNLRPLN